MSVSRARKVFQQLLAEAGKFTDYNFRNHAIRRANFFYKDVVEINNEQELTQHISNMQKDIDMIKRQVVIGNMYPSEQHMLDGGNKH